MPAISANPLQDLANLPEREREDRGVLHTVGEILRQPDLWPETIERAVKLFAPLSGVLSAAMERSRAGIVLTGAGTSHFIGDCLEPPLRCAFGRPVSSIESTEFVTGPEALGAHDPLMLVSIARSGGSPESAGVYRLARSLAPGLLQIAITCNSSGALAGLARSDGAPCLELAPATEDRGLAMTCSATNLFVAGLGLANLERLDEYQRLGEILAGAGRRLLLETPAVLWRIAEVSFERAIFLGSGALLGAAREASLKMLEMTDGRIPTIAHSYLGVRHGPLSFADSRTVIVAFRSADPRVRPYEDDLLAQLATKGFGRNVVSVDPLSGGGCREARTIPLFAAGESLPDAWLPALALPVAQVLALFTSLRLGCRPDQPSTSGLISRVVEGVILHDPD